MAKHYRLFGKAQSLTNTNQEKREGRIMAIGFMTLADIEYLDNLYDDYYDECKDNGKEPLNKEQWYKEVYKYGIA